MKSNSKGQSPKVLTKGSGCATTGRVSARRSVISGSWVQVHSRDPPQQINVPPVKGPQSPRLGLIGG